MKFNESNPFGLSIGDLMAALLLIFVLLLMSTLLKLEKERQNVYVIAKEYLETKEKIYEALKYEFRMDTTIWGASINENLVVRFHSPHVLFDSGSDDLEFRFKQILDDFFPRYVSVLSRDEFLDYISEIRIEGHTDTTGPGRDPYIYNMELSQGRTRSTLEYCLNSIKNSNKSHYKWTKNLVTANGLSSSRLILDEQGNEDREASRRVEFRVITNAEERIDEILFTQISQK